MERKRIVELIRQQIQPAVGCTEPAAVGYATALAVRELGTEPETVTALVSRNILKNAMGVGIPGTGMVGLPIAIALSVVCGDAEAQLAVFHGVTEEAVAKAKRLAESGRIRIGLAEEGGPLYIRVTAEGGGHTCSVVIEDTHTHVSSIQLDDEMTVFNATFAAEGTVGEDEEELTLDEIDAFVRTAETEELTFLRDCVETNLRIAREGLEHEWGLAIGQSIRHDRPMREMTDEEYALAVTCSAADARMGGCTLPVMSACGSGNQGLTATLPVIAVCEKRQLPEKTMLRALAYSLLVTIHVKRHIGHLSALCACSVGASIGTAAALTWLDGGDRAMIGDCICNVIADVSGVICDGAKATCAMKVATGVSSAFRSKLLAQHHHKATVTDGIVGRDAEATIDDLGVLCEKGMRETDRVILDILVSK